MKHFETCPITHSNPSMYIQYLWAKMKPEQQTTEQLKLYQSVQSADPSKQKLFQLYNRTKVLSSYRCSLSDITKLHGLSNPLTSRHQVVSKDRQAEVSCQGCQGGLDAREFLGEACGFRPKVAESTETKDAVGMVAKYVVPAGQQVVGFN